MTGTFDEMRPKLEKQYENAVYAQEGAWDESQLRAALAAHRREFPDEDRLTRRAFLTALTLRHAPVAVEPDMPFPGKFRSFDLWREDVDEGSRIAEEKFPGVRLCVWPGDRERGIGWMVDRSHIAPDWRAVLTLGIPGLIARAQTGDSPLHRAVETIYGALADFCRRTAEINHAPALARIADHAPETLEEAFQLAAVVHDAIEFFGAEVRSMGKFDALYIDFYRRDLAAGRLTRESAKELIKKFWVLFYARYQGKRFGKNFCFGPEFNELSYLGMEAYYEMNIVDPKLSVLVRDDMPEDFALLYAKSIRDGRTGIVSLNYDVVVEGLIRHGRTPEDARDFIPIGCYEPAVAGKEASCSGSCSLNLAVQVASVLDSGTDFADFAAFRRAVAERCREVCGYMREQQVLCDLAWKYVNPVPLVSGTFASCMACGRDISDAGAQYNSTGCVVSYIGDAVDSLAAIRYAVYEHHLCTLAELRGIVRNNWQGAERLRRKILRDAPKWGNGDPAADELGIELAQVARECLWTLPNGRGGRFFPALFGQMVVENGREIGAFASGRLAGEPMSKNMDAVIGMDRNGITGLMGSVLKIDMRQFPDGTCLDLMLHPSSVAGEGGPAVIAQIIRTFIRHGGSGIQFNIFDAAILRDAQKHPEKYGNLQVRVCGWNVRFTDLEPDAQETFIRQAEGLTA